MEGLIGLIVLVLLAVSVLLIVALAMIGGLKSRVAWLEVQVAQLQTANAGAASAEPTLVSCCARANPRRIRRPMPPPSVPSSPETALALKYL